MNKGLLFLAVTTMFIAGGCSQQKEAAAPAEQAAVQEQAQAMADKGVAEMDEAKKNVQEAVGNLSSQAKELLVKAKQFVDSGNFDQAIQMAQQVLNIDPNNLEAKGIIEMAKAKLAEMAQNQVADAKNNLTNKLNAFGK